MCDECQSFEIGHESTVDFVIEKDARTTSKTAVLQCRGVPNGNSKTTQKTKPVKRKRKQKRTSKKTKKAKISNKETKECEESDWDTEVWVSSDSDSTMCVSHSLPPIGDSDTDPDIPKLERQDGNAAWYFNKPEA